MSDYPPDPRDSRPAATSLADVAEGALRKFVTALVLSSGLIALAIYSRPAPPRYQAFIESGRIIRIDTRSGTILACEENRCMQVVRRGQRLVRSLGPAALPAPDVQPRIAPAAPQPEAAPAAK